MLYVTTLIATIRRIVEFAEQFQRGMTGIERFAEIMDTPVTIGDAPDAVPLQPGPGDIRFENVSFEYPDDHNKVLHNVSLDIRPGERLALEFFSHSLIKWSEPPVLERASIMISFASLRSEPERTNFSTVG